MRGIPDKFRDLMYHLTKSAGAHETAIAWGVQVRKQFDLDNLRLTEPPVCAAERHRELISSMRALGKAVRT